MSRFTNLLRSLLPCRASADPMEEASPRDIALLLEQLAQQVDEAKAALLAAEVTEWRPDKAAGLCFAVRDCVASAGAADQVVWVVLRREEEMAALAERIRYLPEAGGS